jgi:hypothetical protein
VQCIAIPETIFSTTLEVQSWQLIFRLLSICTAFLPTRFQLWPRLFTPVFSISNNISADTYTCFEGDSDIFPFHPRPSCAYSFPPNMPRWVMVDDTDASIKYTGDWFANTGTLDSSGNWGAPYLSTLHGTKTQGSFSYSFSGQCSA